MPNKASAKKALRQSITRRKKNVAQNRSLRDVVKKCRKATESNSPEVGTALSKAYKALDKAAKTNLIKRNKANRLKSRLTKAIMKNNKVEETKASAK